MRSNRLASRVAGALAPPRTHWRRHLPVPALLAVGLSLGLASPSLAQPPGVPTSSPAASSSTAAASAHPYAGHVAEAARRFGIPEAWIWSVMRVESAGVPNATSHAGAMGLMQVMPGTYAELRSRHGLGPDPYVPRDNILAGAAYLREMHDRYGPTGMLAAYNAGPGRWEDHLARGRPLPAETVAYMARLGAAVGGSAAPSPTAPAQVDRFAWRRASLFVALDGRGSDRGSDAESAQLGSVAAAAPGTSPNEATDTASARQHGPADAHFAVTRPE